MVSHTQDDPNDQMVPHAHSDPGPPVALAPWLRDALIILTCAAACALYLARSGQLGYPLDDAWIYQAYARNLAVRGEWAFLPGQPSTGSTSILWTLLLAPGYGLPLDPRVWTLGVGVAALAAVALGVARLCEEGSSLLPLFAGLAVALEWHLVWAAVSGMETALFAALLVWFWVWLQRHDPAHSKRPVWNGLLTGAWGGVLMLTRPEGVLALGVAGLYGLLARPRLADRLRWGIGAGIGFVLFLGPFFAFNAAVSGTVWPNTFYAKQTEYAALWGRPYLFRLVDQVWAGLVGAQLLLMPGLVADVWRQVRAGGRSRWRSVDWAALLPLGWMGLHWALYAARLPVTYQHGRYAMPAIPVLLVVGIRGTAALARPRARRTLVRIGSLAWLLAAATLLPAVLGVLGAPAYARDVAFIQNEMVATAHWIDAHTSPGTVVAAHDIGALGYFAPRSLIDLAGLVSPEVIPFINSADGLANYIVSSGAEYLVVFPRWNLAYADLVSRPAFEPVWSAAEQADYRPLSGLGPMTVYRVRGVETGR